MIFNRCLHVHEKALASIYTKMMYGVDWDTTIPVLIRIIRTYAISLILYQLTIIKAACYLSILVFFFTVSAFAGQVVAKQKAKIKDKIAVRATEKRAALMRKWQHNCKLYISDSSDTN
ncbi:hypothetical protein BDB01DRAFT_838183 [Pilobolus umbonatus]|nr:hypothetical protein BDB01DRAFT_838183 [Pilobolus umbonatus]